MDAHVHVHDCFDLHEFLDAAARNFASCSSQTESPPGCEYVACLTETFGTDEFGELKKRADDRSSGTDTSAVVWQFQHGSTGRAVVARHPKLGEITIVAGRQIVTAEKLEILALGTTEKWDDGLAASDVIESVDRSGAIPVLPWGFGKWLGRRRRVVETLIDRFKDGLLYLGDNSGRPGILPNPAEFSLARKLGMRILPGSDPLPFASESGRAGSFGFFVDNVDDCDDVWTGLRKLLRQGDGILHRYGPLESPYRFVRNQVAMQYITRIANRRKTS